jgi:hypothetical protein
VYQTSSASHDPYQTIRLWYRVHVPGVILPNKYHYSLDLSHDIPTLLIEVEDGQILTRLDTKGMFTLENPMRLKRFLEIQLESA